MSDLSPIKQTISQTDHPLQYLEPSPPHLFCNTTFTHPSSSLPGRTSVDSFISIRMNSCWPWMKACIEAGVDSIIFSRRDSTNILGPTLYKIIQVYSLHNKLYWSIGKGLCRDPLQRFYPSHQKGSGSSGVTPIHTEKQYSPSSRKGDFPCIKRSAMSQII